MNERRNKPRVFLSHSKADVTFVRRLYNDLRRCQIEPWLDDEEIRHGKPWLDAIFERGIPTCDCVLVYLTKHSIVSKMVKKELDAALLQQLKDEYVSLLPYVENQDLRPQLRSDLQSLQIPVLNDENYTTLLPCVATEIWCSYLERTLAIAVQSEKLKRIEAEVKLRDLEVAQGEGVFSDAEDREFQSIRDRLARFEKVNIVASKKVQGKQGQAPGQHFHFEVELLSFFPAITSCRQWDYSDHLVLRSLEKALYPIILEENPGLADAELSISQYPQLAADFLMYGFVRRIYREPPSSARLDGMLGAFKLSNARKLEYMEKVERFKYWLTYNEESPTEIKWRPYVPPRENSGDKLSEAGG